MEVAQTDSSTVNEASNSNTQWNAPQFLDVPDGQLDVPLECLDTEEDVITTSLPPTEIVDTVVTTTTNPDGSLKRTTCKTTRRVVTTTRVRRIRTTNPPQRSIEPGAPTVSNTVALPHTTDSNPKVITLVKPGKEGNADGKFSEASFTFIPPTQICYEESDKPDDELASKMNKPWLDLQGIPSSELEIIPDQYGPDTDASKPRPKTTVRKTVTASTAMFYAKGMSKCIVPLAESNEDSEHDEAIDFKEPQSLRENLEDITEDNEVRKDACSVCSTTANSTTTTTMTKRTRIINSTAGKNLFINPLESLRKQFGLWGSTRDSKSDSERKSASAEHVTDTQQREEDVGTDQWALLVMKESERLFSQAKPLFLQAGDEEQQQQPIVMHSSSEHQSHECSSTSTLGDDKSESSYDLRFHSRFSNLPLYQGYGLIAQQLSDLGKTHIMTSVPTTEADNMNSAQSKTEHRESGRISIGLNVGQLNSAELSSDVRDVLTSTWVNLLDQSMENYLGDASHIVHPMWKVDHQALELPPPQYAIEGSSIESISPQVDSHITNDLKRTTLTRPEPLDESIHSDTSLSAPSTPTTPVGTKSQHDLHSRVSESSEEPKRPQLRHLGVGVQGAFRVAWSDMPEVKDHGAAASLTRHEIQLQEAMFEVITSEASYYQSLNVLVNHFYRAPMFEYNNPGTSNGTVTSRQTQQQSLHGSRGSDTSSGVTGNSNSLISRTSFPSQASSASLSSSLPTPSTADTLLDEQAPSGGAYFNPYASRRAVLKPLEKHHLFSNVLLVCLASEKFLQDLEDRWVSRMPVLNEVCDLIVKHAGGATFEPYITYLRNQAYQMETLHKLCQRDGFRSVLDSLHGHPASGKNSLSSFLALPMQRLTRLKLLVEVIRSLQDAIIQDAALAASEPGSRPPPTRVPTERERQNVQCALRELSRLLDCSQTEKDSMDNKARLITLSNSLEFPDDVKIVTISDKRLIKEGELREASMDGRISMLQKLSLRKPHSFYFILFNDLLLVTKKKKNDRYLVLDYCDRGSVHAEAHCTSTSPPRSSSAHQRIGKLVNYDDLSRPNADANLSLTSEGLSSLNVPSSRRGLSRSGSSLSSYQVRSFGRNIFTTGNISDRSTRTSFSPPPDRAKVDLLHVVLIGSQNGAFTEMFLLPKDSDDFNDWCKALAISPDPVSPSKPASVQPPRSCDEHASDAEASVAPLIPVDISPRRLPTEPLNRKVSSQPSPVQSSPNSSKWLNRARKACSFRRSARFSVETLQSPSNIPSIIEQNTPIATLPENHFTTLGADNSFLTKQVPITNA